MDILKIFFEADTTGLDKANSKVKNVADSSGKAQGQASKLKDALKDVGGTSNLVGEVTGKMDALKGQLGSVVNVARLFPPLLLAAVAAAGILAAIRFAGPLDDITKMADKFGLSATQAAVMAQNMDPGGIQSYFAAIDRVANVLNKVDEESKQAQEAFRALGISAKDNADPVKLLSELTEKYGQRLKEGNLTNDETAALQSILGKSYRETMMQVNEAAYAQERLNYWSEAGLGISKDGATASNEFADAQDYLADMFKIVGSQLVGEVVPAFTGLIRAFVDSYKNGGLVATAFGVIRVAVQVIMVPIRLLINNFIALDASIRMVGKGIGALFASIATGSLAPFKMLKEDIEDIWKTANSRMTWGGFDSGEVEGPSALPSGGGTSSAVKKKNDAKKAKEFSSGQFRADKNALDWEEQYAEYLQKQRIELEKLRDTYLRMGDPLIAYQEQQREIENLMVAFPDKAEVLFNAWLKIQDQIDETTKTTTKASEEFDMMKRVADTAFSGLEDAIVGLATTGKLNFSNFATAILADIARMIIQLRIIKPMMDSMKGGGWGTFVQGLFSANGNAFDKTGVLKSAKGNVFSNPTLHGYAGGIGMLGEAGPEAIMPLKRGADGKLGIASSGGTSGSSNQFNITVNVQGGENPKQTGEIFTKQMIDVINGLVIKENARHRKQVAQGVYA